MIVVNPREPKLLNTYQVGLASLRKAGESLVQLLEQPPVGGTFERHRIQIVDGVPMLIVRVYCYQYDVAR